MPKTVQETVALDLADFFSAFEARTDRRRQLSTIGRVWFAELSPLESYWANPGPRQPSSWET